MEGDAVDNELLSIGDMARITGASVQALRYYDREGIVRPAYVSGRTGYRYYSPSQTINVDAALACVELGIPLKEARSMLEGEVFGTRRLFERGVKVARERALAAEAALRVSEDCLELMLSNDAPREGSLTTKMQSRLVLSALWQKAIFDLQRYYLITGELSERAKEAGLVPSYLCGFWRSSDEDAPWRVFVSVFQPEAEGLAPLGTSPLEGQPRTDTVVGGTFGAYRVTRSTSTEAHQALFDMAETLEGEAIICERWFESQRIGSFTVDLLTRP